MSDYKGTTRLSPVLPDTLELVDDLSFDADWLREALFDRTIKACIPPRRGKTKKLPLTDKFTGTALRLRGLFTKRKEWGE